MQTINTNMWIKNCVEKISQGLGNYWLQKPSSYQGEDQG
jgi:hypothetical protein